ncbi:MAG: Nif3-like dinuclear metal center hexameric protein [Nanoarchaeota archaeon]|nr:Nif3-like dinuclear metal center hexameric protein [Nanoarchaeota archaeon]
MASRDNIVQFLNEFLEIDKFNDKVLNGLEVEGKNEVKKIVFGVSPSIELFNKSVSANADMIILHHGLISDFDSKHIYKLKKQRLKILFDNDINLVAYHLPLDAHYDSGNNAQIMKKLGMELQEVFDVGFIAKYADEKDVNDVVTILNKELGTNCTLLKLGKDKIKTAAIISGGGGSNFLDAVFKGVDLYITGDSMEHMYELAKESKTNIIFAGHYNSEKLGVIAIAGLLKEKFNIETEFIDVPNKL